MGAAQERLKGAVRDALGTDLPEGQRPRTMQESVGGTQDIGDPFMDMDKGPDPTFDGKK